MANEEFIEIHWTSGTLDEARRISRYLAQERYVACAQIIPWIESVYMWNNKLETAQESKVVLKTRAENYNKIREIIEQNCKYEVPEITWFKIEGGNKSYMEWLQESTFVQQENLSH
ncbi:divalent-cation tolerance protein CutA [Candidatus Protochlamydia phocaeensis]|uniref:divalent-cation tolerance protein CutA n=1 Tax=Candidatus Protochlamydia phocaeensis TaxID=1414722 RepID=UPI0008393702|nr:divalent-cation tolerance protein CutA [Candidatus Protochlamydia phocaeensis]